MATPLPTAPHVGAWTVNTGAVPRVTDDSAPRLATAHLPRYSGARDLQSPEEFLERLENFCLVTGVAADKRLTHMVPAALEGGAKLWWRFVRGFNSWEQFTAAFRSEFSSIDAKRRLKAELEQRTQHLEENLKEFIYAIATFYDRIGEEVSEAEKVQRVLRQMHPQWQDLAEGHAYNDLAELVKAADGLMERAWRRLQYRPPPLPSNQVARDLAFRPSQAPRPSLTAAAEHYGDGVGRFVCCCPTGTADLSLATASSCARPVVLPRPTVLVRHCAFVLTLRLGPMPRQGPASGAMHVQCHRCGGFGHISLNCATGRRMGPPVCFRCQRSGHLQAQCPGNQWR
ncbi:hypothetical protein MRX96_038668 [Rhipicephalus microplus]